MLFESPRHDLEYPTKTLAQVHNASIIAKYCLQKEYGCQTRKKIKTLYQLL